MNIKFKLNYLCLVPLIFLLSACTNNSGENDTTVKVGVTSLDSEIHAYDILEEDLEKRLNLDIELVNVTPDSESVQTNDDYMEHLDRLLSENVVDMCIGIPSYQLATVIENNRLLDISNSIVEIENIHKGAIDLSKKMGNGNMYFISSTLDNIYMVFQNQNILDELNGSLPTYISWDEFKKHLDNNEQIIQDNNLSYDGLALAVKDIGSEDIFVGYEFFLQALGLETRLIENNRLTPAAENYFKIFSKIISDYGKGYEEFENAKYPKDYIFTTGNYAYMLGQSYDLEVFLNTDLNNSLNSTSPFSINLNFPLKVSFINFDGSNTQNLRESSIFINKQTQNKEECISILNTLLSKEYALKMIDSRGKYSHFTSSMYYYPTYYDSATIAELNKSYDGKFDISILYDVDHVNPTYHNAIDMNTIIKSFDEAFTRIYKNKGDDSIIENTIINMENEWNSLND